MIHAMIDLETLSTNPNAAILTVGGEKFDPYTTAEPSQFNTYDECMLQAVSVTNYMRDLYPSSAGEIHCLDEKDYAEYKAFIDNGGKPALSLSPPENIKNSI